MKTLEQIIAEQEKIKQDRINRALQPIRDDIERGKLAPLSVCDNCGEDRQCKVYPINSQSNAILCRACFTKEENFLRMNYMSQDTTSWTFLKWYGLD